MVWWLAKGLHEKGVQVVLVGRRGSSCPFARVVPHQFSAPLDEEKLEVDLVHHFVTPPSQPKLPYLVTIGGNGKLGETYLPNTVFVSQNHALRHNAEAFVYNGIDPDDYIFESRKDNFLLFLAKASWKVKNVRGACHLAKQSNRPLCVIGGNRPWWSWNRSIHWHGLLGGQKKRGSLPEVWGSFSP